MSDDIQARARRWLQEFDGYADEDVLLDLAEPLIRDLLAAVEARQWQPIATAPKDGTHVLISDGVEVCEAYYDCEDWEWMRANLSIDDDDCIVEPTHWMPLPAPPEAAR